MKNDLQVALVKKAKKGDIRAFFQLCEAYQVVLYNSAYKLLQNNEDVADCLQETEIRAWEKIKKLKNDAAFNTWIFKIMINVAKTILKKRVDMIQYDDNDWSVVDKRYVGSDLETVFMYLPEKYKIPIVLHYYAGFDVKEIANQLDMPKNTVKTRLARGREKLKILLEGEWDGEKKY
ncbi:sigma-70 family RNA polymerase sigma factor [Enterococcus sp. BWB1-3]|uniref:RNA polymerase sigma factor n=1 Tax=Enterococcus sp. BWB1-3 TaxID=2787713 RepID=UPI0019210A86|nr:sigma-70 family RNA polymerase sigma factor [Enterococcus sp. BWB1-3]MBL1228218.1 sigma-70 family RNA polymerase sigma factor [Enterococcus sp. BWB1-3]